MASLMSIFFLVLRKTQKEERVRGRTAEGKGADATGKRRQDEKKARGQFSSEKKPLRVMFS